MNDAKTTGSRLAVVFTLLYLASLTQHVSNKAFLIKTIVWLAIVGLSALIYKGIIRNN